MRPTALAIIGPTLLLSILAAGTSGDPDRSESGPLIDLNFNGGTVAAYIEALRKAAGAVNIVVAPEGEGIDVPAVRLTRVSIEGALKVLDDRRGHTARGGSGLYQLGTGRIGPDDSGGTPIFVVRAESLGRDPIVAPLAQSSAVWAVSDVLESGVKPEDILTAVETALAMIGAPAAGADGGKARGGPDAAEPAQLRFHAATGLLLGRGTGEHISAINEVVSSARAAASQRTTSPLMRTQSRVRELTEQLANCMARLEGRAPRENESEPPPER